jgi:hypothetical protein
MNAELGQLMKAVKSRKTVDKRQSIDKVLSIFSNLLFLLACTREKIRYSRDEYITHTHTHTHTQQEACQLQAFRAFLSNYFYELKPHFLSRKRLGKKRGFFISPLSHREKT